MGRDEGAAHRGGLAPAALGAQVTLFDPDLDPDGSQARLVAEIIAEGLGALGDRRT